MTVNRPDWPPSAESPLLLSARDLAAMLRLSLRTVRSMDAAGKLPAPAAEPLPDDRRVLFRQLNSDITAAQTRGYR